MGAMPLLDGACVPSRVFGVLEVMLGVEVVVLDRSNERCHVLNPTSGVVWSCIDGRLTLNEIADVIAAEAGVERSEIDPIVTLAVAGFVEAGFVQIDVEQDDFDAGRSPDVARVVDEAEQRRQQVSERRAQWEPARVRVLDGLEGMVGHGPWAFGDVVASVVTDDPEAGHFLDRVLGEIECDPAPDVPIVRVHIVGRRRPVGRRSVYVDGRLLRARTDPRVAIEITLRELNRLAAERTRSSLLLHAGAVEFDGRVVVVAGPSGSGKSTLVAALVKAGGGYLTDDLVIIDPTDFAVRPFPRPFELGRGSLAMLGLEAHDPFVADKHRLEPGLVGLISTGGPLAVVVLLAPEGTEAVPLTPVEALTHLVPESFAATFDHPGSFEALARLSASVPAMRLPRTDLETAVGAVLRLLRT